MQTFISRWALMACICGMLLAAGCGYDDEIDPSAGQGRDVFINAPANGSAFPAGTMVLLEGMTAETVTADTFAWFSDRDGYLGGDISVETDELSVGEHIIQFLAYSGGVELGKMEIRITIYDPGV